MAPPSPVVAQWELSLLLQAKRERIGMSVPELSQRLGFTRNYWSLIINEHKMISEKALRDLFEVLEFGSEDREKLLEIRAIAARDAWWNDYMALLDREVRRLYGLEYGAHEIRNFENILIPGMLQTPDYARSVIRADATIRQVEIEQRVEIRMRRQERLHGDDPVRLQVIVCEAALRQQIGGVSVLKGQLDHLVDSIEALSEALDFRVIPFTAEGCNLFGSGTLLLMDFSSPHLPTIAWRENVSSWGVISAVVPVRDLDSAFGQGLSRSLDARQTLDRIINYRRELC